MIQFKPTRNIDLIEAVGNHPDIIAGSNNGDGYDYKPDCRYFEVNVHGQFGGIVYYQEIQPLTFDCHAMYLPEIRGFSKKIGLAFWRYILTNTTVQCITSFAARKFRHGQMYCAMIGLKPEKMQSRLSKLSMLPIHCHLCSQWRHNNQKHSNNHSKVDLCLILVKP